MWPQHGSDGQLCRQRSCRSPRSYHCDWQWRPRLQAWLLRRKRRCWPMWKPTQRAKHVLARWTPRGQCLTTLETHVLHRRHGRAMESMWRGSHKAIHMALGPIAKSVPSACGTSQGRDLLPATPWSTMRRWFRRPWCCSSRCFVVHFRRKRSWKPCWTRSPRRRSWTTKFSTCWRSPTSRTPWRFQSPRQPQRMWRRRWLSPWATWTRARRWQVLPTAAGIRFWIHQIVATWRTFWPSRKRSTCATWCLQERGWHHPTKSSSPKKANDFFEPTFDHYDGLQGHEGGDDDDSNYESPRLADSHGWTGMFMGDCMCWQQLADSSGSQPWFTCTKDQL